MDSTKPLCILIAVFVGIFQIPVLHAVRWDKITMAWGSAMVASQEDSLGVYAWYAHGK